MTANKAMRRPSTIFRYVLDATILALMVVMLLFDITGDLIHEVLGIALFVLVIVHCVLNHKWFRSIPRALGDCKGHGRRTFLVVCDILLIVSMTLCAVSSVFVSLSLFASVQAVGSRAAWVMLHDSSAYVAFAVMALHFGLHWRAFARYIRVGFSSAKPMLGQVAAIVMTTLVVALGAGAYGMNRLVMLNTIQGIGTQGSKPFDVNTVTEKTSSQSSSADNMTSESDGSKGSQVSTGSNEASSTSPLDGQYCTLCGKHCPLTAPACAKGIALAQKMLNGA